MDKNQHASQRRDNAMLWATALLIAIVGTSSIWFLQNWGMPPVWRVASMTMAASVLLIGYRLRATLKTLIGVVRFVSWAAIHVTLLSLLIYIFHVNIWVWIIALLVEAKIATAYLVSFNRRKASDV